jgi:TfoX/Sxy family transcriptional regulator of competence genes
MPMKIPKPDSAVMKIFEELTPVTSGVSTRKVFGQPAAFVNGNMFFGVFGEKLFVRLSEADLAEAKNVAGFVPFEPMPGRAMREYWVFPPSILRNPAEARKWVGRSQGYASSLSPKKAKSKSRRS